MDDALLTAKQLAGYLNLNERTVLKLVADGSLPGMKIGGQWRFRKATIDAWLDDQMLGVLPKQIETPRRPADVKLMELASCFQVEHVIPALTAKTKTTAIEELAAHAAALGLVKDRTWFVGALIERENVLPSAIGGGVAFLHTLRRNPEQVVKPFMVLGRSREGIDFDALDGKPTHLFFVLGLKYEELHLPWLHKLSQMLVRPEAVATLLNAADAATIYRALVDTERRLLPTRG